MHSPNAASHTSPRIRILITSDLHEVRLEDVAPKDILDSLDFIVSAGDYGNYPYPKQAIGVYGNHCSLSEVASEKPSLINVDRSLREYMGMTFLGISGVFCGEKRYHSQRRMWYHQSESDIAKYLEEAPRATFFITHTRAHGVFDKMRGWNLGSKVLRSYVDRTQPDFYVSGHLTNPGRTKMAGRTLCINATGPDWNYVLLDLPEKRTRFMKREQDA